MTIQTSTLRPGLLVSLKTSVRGNVRYTKTELDVETSTEAGAPAVAKWETTRIVALPEEHDAARKARSRARKLIEGACSYSAFGLLCPEAAAENLARAIEQARKIADEFNETAVVTRISVYVITGRIAPDDEEAVKAISSELRDLMEEMERGVRNLDVKLIRENASRAKEVGMMLSPEMQAKVALAVEAARGAAKKLVQAGDTAAREIDSFAIRQITDARNLFLDLDEQKAVAKPAEEQRALDLAPAPEVKAPKTVANGIEV